jgi:hypothetical protein
MALRCAELLPLLALLSRTKDTSNCIDALRDAWPIDFECMKENSRATIHVTPAFFEQSGIASYGPIVSF